MVAWSRRGPRRRRRRRRRPRPSRRRTTRGLWGHGPVSERRRPRGLRADAVTMIPPTRLISAPRAAERRRVAGHVSTIQALAGRPGGLVATVRFTSVGRPRKHGRHDARRRSGDCCPSEVVGGFAVACARRGREQGEREPGEHLLMGAGGGQARSAAFVARPLPRNSVWRLIDDCGVHRLGFMVWASQPSGRAQPSCTAGRPGSGCGARGGRAFGGECDFRRLTVRRCWDGYGRAIPSGGSGVGAGVLHAPRGSPIWGSCFGVAGT